MDFSLSVAIDPPTATLTATGELDIFTAREVAGRLTDAMDAQCHWVRVDLAGVTFVDASALGVLERANRAVAAQGGSLGFVATSRPFRRLCTLTGLDLVLQVS